MNQLLTDGNRMFAYSIDGLWDDVKLKSNYIVSQSSPDAIDKNRLTEDEKALFTKNLQRIMSDVFFPLSVLARDIENAVSIIAGVPEQLEPVTIGSGNLSDSIPGGQPPAIWTTDHIVYKVTMPTYWSENLLTSIDVAIYDALTYNSMMKLYRERGQNELFLVVRDKYESDIALVKSLINYRRQPSKKTYRAF
jgi:hypothetical protein